MFGYVRIKKDSLSAKQMKSYRSYYCALCKNIGIYSNFTRAMLSYDMVFLMILSNPNMSVEINEKRKNCWSNRVNDTINYWAIISIFMIKYKIENDISDHDWRLLPFWVNANHAMKKIDTMSEIRYCIQEYLSQIAQYESANSSDAEAISGLFGMMIKEIIQKNPVCHSDLDFISDIGFWLGKWIYLIDAYDDQNKDEKKKDYNPFLMYKKENGPLKSKRYSLYLLSNCLDRITHLTELLPYAENTPIIENVLLQWLPFKTDMIINKRGDSL